MSEFDLGWHQLITAVARCNNSRHITKQRDDSDKKESDGDNNGDN